MLERITLKFLLDTIFFSQERHYGVSSFTPRTLCSVFFFSQFSQRHDHKLTRLFCGPPLQVKNAKRVLLFVLLLLHMKGLKRNTGRPVFAAAEQISRSTGGLDSVSVSLALLSPPSCDGAPPISLPRGISSQRLVITVVPVDGFVRNI